MTKPHLALALANGFSFEAGCAKEKLTSSLYTLDHGYWTMKLN